MIHAICCCLSVLQHHYLRCTALDKSICFFWCIHWDGSLTCFSIQSWKRCERELKGLLQEECEVMAPPIGQEMQSKLFEMEESLFFHSTTLCLVSPDSHWHLIHSKINMQEIKTSKLKEWHFFDILSIERRDAPDGSKWAENHSREASFDPPSVGIFFLREISKAVVHVEAVFLSRSGPQMSAIPEVMISAPQVT